MAVDGRHATVLVPGGALIRLRLPVAGARPGDEILIPDWAARGRAGPGFRGQRVALALTAAAVVLAVVVASVALLVRPLPAVALVSVDINPSLGLAVDRLMRVVSAEALDDGGAELLAELELGGRRPQLDDFLIKLAAGAAGHLAGADDVWLVLGASPADPERALTTQFREDLERAREVAIQGLVAPGGGPAPEVHSALLSVPPEVAADASAAGVSLGRYSMVLAARDAGVPDVDLAGADGGELIARIKAAGQSPAEVLARAASAEELRGMWQRHRDHIHPGIGPPHDPGRRLDDPDDDPDDDDDDDQSDDPAQGGGRGGSNGRRRGGRSDDRPGPDGEADDPDDERPDDDGADDPDGDDRGDDGAGEPGGRDDDEDGAADEGSGDGAEDDPAGEPDDEADGDDEAEDDDDDADEEDDDDPGDDDDGDGDGDGDDDDDDPEDEPPDDPGGSGRRGRPGGSPPPRA